MNFTDAEEKLAKQLKEAGLEWKPEIGDYYLDEDSNIELLTTETMNWWLTGYYHYSLPVSKKVWLPLWHQSRKRLKDLGWIVVAFFDLEGSVNLRITKEEKENPSQALGIEFDTITILESATDLEAMYKALLEAQGKNKMEVLQ